MNATLYVDKEGNPMQQTMQLKPTMAENLDFFLVYQLNHMYWRYFMWNFAGRQNDIQGNGEVNRGNWISGIPFIDNARLGDQSLLPADQGSENKGHNVFYMLPLLLGIIGIGWQAFVSKRGIEQFWVVFFLFFMTGIAIVLYLNQTPGQPRERDYAFAWFVLRLLHLGGNGSGRLVASDHACSARQAWCGTGHAGDGEAGIYPAEEQPGKLRSRSMAAAVVAAAVGLLVPLQMVSQTWDDHDRSGRYTTRDFGNNYLNSLDENAIVFTNGDNDTFPLWYAQEVEGTRTDVKVVNLSYLTTDWYVDQVRRPSYEAPGIDMQARPADYAYDRLQFAYFLDNDTVPVDALASLRQIYSPESRQNSWGLPIVKHPNMYVPVDTAALVAACTHHSAGGSGGRRRDTCQSALRPSRAGRARHDTEQDHRARHDSHFGGQRLESSGLLRHDRPRAVLYGTLALYAQQRSGLRGRTAPKFVRRSVGQHREDVSQRH